MIPQYHKSNFSTLQRAAKAGHLALMDAQRKSDGQTVSLICMVGFDNGDYTFTPVAEMIAYTDNPFDLYNPPAQGGGYVEVE